MTVSGWVTSTENHSLDAHRAIDVLLADILRLEVEHRKLTADLAQMNAARIAWANAALELDARLDEAQSNVKALLAANQELQAVVTALCRSDSRLLLRFPIAEVRH